MNKNISNIESSDKSYIKIDYKDGDLLKVKLLWNTDCDLDLCAFFESKDGSVGGVFPSEYNHLKQNSMGSLFSPPYIYLMGETDSFDDVKVCCEEIRVTRLAEMNSISIVVIDYDSVIDDRDANFSKNEIVLVIETINNGIIKLTLDSDYDGHIYKVCSIINRDGEIVICRDDTVMHLCDAFEKIHGFSSILTQDNN